MGAITGLGYIGLSVSSLSAWTDFAAKIVGLEVVDEGEKGRLYFRMDEWHHRIALIEDGKDDLAYVGWRVAGPTELDSLAEKLTIANISFALGTEEEAVERHVLGLLKLKSPGGISTEVFYGPRVDKHKPFHPGRPMFGRFVTGDQGLGHLILNEPDPQAAMRFYELLGMRGSIEYKVNVPGGGVAKPIFMKVNDRQHSVAFGLAPNGKRINHLMIEYTHLDDLGIAHDLVRASKIDVSMQLGKHANDEALTFYCANPSGWLIELGWGGKMAGLQQEYHVSDIFGHGIEAAGYGVDLEL